MSLLEWNSRRDMETLLPSCEVARGHVTYCLHLVSDVISWRWRRCQVQASCGRGTKRV